MALSDIVTGSAVRQRVTVWKKPKDGCSGKFPPEEREFIQNLFEEALEPPYRSSYEHQWRCRDGGSRLISFTISTYFEENTIQCYSVTGLDVTKLRRMEEELWRYRTDLEEQITERSVELLDSRTRLAGIVDSAEDAIISVDSKQQITLFNYGRKYLRLPQK